MMTRLFAALLALEARAQLFAAGAGLSVLLLADAGPLRPLYAIAAISLFLIHDLLSQRLRRR